ncbi:MAG: hypothetical protein HP492_02500 [Nitrospira sp.]|nr:hypothetical protein [Nitrospira sp.]
MRMFFGVLSALAFLLASRRFYLTESVGYDIGGLFLLLVGIQLFIAAAIFHEHHESRKPKPPAPAEGNKGVDESLPHSR